MSEGFWHLTISVASILPLLLWQWWRESRRRRAWKELEEAWRRRFGEPR